MISVVVPMACNDFKPPVKSVLIKRPGAKRGSRYVNVASLRAYMQSMEGAV
jgi:hypothetical protein